MALLCTSIPQYKVLVSFRQVKYCSNCGPTLTGNDVSTAAVLSCLHSWDSLCSGCALRFLQYRSYVCLSAFLPVSLQVTLLSGCLKPDELTSGSYPCTKHVLFVLKLKDIKLSHGFQMFEKLHGSKKYQQLSILVDGTVVMWDIMQEILEYTSVKELWFVCLLLLLYFQYC